MDGKSLYDVFKEGMAPAESAPQKDILKFMCKEHKKYRSSDPVIFDRCPLDNIVYTLWCNNKGNISENDRHKIQRYLLFLEDWHWGHFLQVGNNVLFHWKAGDIYTWKYGMYLLSTNGGIKPKWTCQITGYPTENSLHKSSKFKFKIGE